MTAPTRLHILGAAGSGTTTLGRMLAQHFGLVHLDTDDFFWEATDPPYTVRRPAGERLTRLQAALADAAGTGWVLSGSLCGWGDPLIGQFDAVIFISLSREVRLARLQAREEARFGADLMPGGPMHEQNAEFMRWAAGYDDPEPWVGRSRLRHEAWLAALPCPVLRVENTGTPEALRDQVAQRLARLNPGPSESWPA